jgi:hypothetical protein
MVRVITLLGEPKPGYTPCSAAGRAPAMRPKTIGAVVALPPTRPMPWIRPVASSAA